MIHLDEPAPEYHARPALSAGIAWDIVKPDGCEAIARWNVPWLNPEYVETHDELMDGGTLAHCASFEEWRLDQMMVVIDATDWRTKKARELRDEAYAAGKIPILLRREPGSTGPSFEKLMAIRKALQSSPAAALLFEPTGRNEVSYTFELDGTPCKCRADRITETTMVDLKTALSASPDYFQRAMWSYGHHLRAAFYLEGWKRQDTDPDYHPIEDYVFVVVGRDPPHLVSLFRCDQQSLAWGERMYISALLRFRRAVDTGKWPAWMVTSAPQTVSLPTWAIHHLADREAVGDL